MSNTSKPIFGICSGYLRPAAGTDNELPAVLIQPFALLARHFPVGKLDHLKLGKEHHFHLLKLIQNIFLVVCLIFLRWVIDR